MKLESQKTGDSLRVALEGSLDTLTAPELEKELATRWNGIGELILDFSGVDYISSAGLRVVMSLVIGAFTLGLILSLLSLGMLVSFRMIRFTDITVDGSITLGASVAAVGIVNGWNPWLATLAATAAGGVAGMITGMITPSLLRRIWSALFLSPRRTDPETAARCGRPVDGRFRIPGNSGPARRTYIAWR